jgi:hypothetical protein
VYLETAAKNPAWMLLICQSSKKSENKREANVRNRGKHIPHKVFLWNKFLGEASKSQNETAWWMNEGLNKTEKGTLF